MYKEATNMSPHTIIKLNERLVKEIFQNRTRGQSLYTVWSKRGRGVG